MLFHAVGALIHLLLIIAVIAPVAHFMTQRRAAGSSSWVAASGRGPVP